MIILLSTQQQQGFKACCFNVTALFLPPNHLIRSESPSCFYSPGKM
jgi:hypothetical protein